MANRIDDFPESIKRTMAERVAWQCSFPNCNQITVGPDSHNFEKRINLGEAAHITAASPLGPRYDSSIGSEQRKQISNGIWMCRHHARLIDADFEEYSVETLRLWKREAERIAAENLKSPNNTYLDESSTLLQIGSEIIFYARWKSVTANTWIFSLLNPLSGNLDRIKSYVESFNRLVEGERYVVIESQGDARVISSSPELSLVGYDIYLTLTIKNPPKSITPNFSTIALKDGDIFLDSSGNIAMLKDTDAAFQDISTCLGTKIGECYFAPEAGSMINYYYKQYKNDLKLLSRLFKLELIRLSLIPVGEQRTSSLPFIKEITSVNIQDIQLRNQCLDIEISVIFGNGEHRTEKIPVFVGL